MGQQLTKDGQCQEKGLLFCCTPEAPPDESSKSQLEPGNRQPYPQTTGEETSGRYGADARGAEASGATDRWEDAAAEEVGFAAPPEVGIAPPAPPEPAPSRAAPREAAPTGHSVTWDLICSDLDSAEQIAYGGAFASFGGSDASPLAMDCEPMRNFIVDHTTLTLDDLDPALFQVAPEFSVTLEGFLQILRENANNDGQSLEQFVGMSSNGETLMSEEARSGLLLFSQRDLQADFSEARWDTIFNSVMRDTAISVDMEQWLVCCKRVARTVRLARYALAPGGR